MSEWISVSKERPNRGEEVLVRIDGHRGPSWSNTSHRVAYWWYDEWVEQGRELDDDSLIGVTHWMPLPPPPEDKP